MDITRKIIFHAGHMLKDDTSKCHAPHGHEYIIECTVEGDVKKEQSGDEVGMVMNFGVLKGIMMDQVHDYFDHKFIIQQNDPRQAAFVKAVNYQGVITVPWAPTAENIAEFCFDLIQRELPKRVKVKKVRVQETSNCWAEYYGEAGS